jgi:hypothetical protein
MQKSIKPFVRNLSSVIIVEEVLLDRLGSFDYVYSDYDVFKDSML